MTVELACQVVPDIPTFAVDDGFTYSIPDGMPISVGSVVRIRVSGRRRRGFVTAVFPLPEDRKLLPVDAISGNRPTFDDDLLEACRRVATHYVAPLSVVLSRTVPPNVPKVRASFSDATGSSSDGGDGASMVVIGSQAPHHQTVIDLLQSNGPAPVIVPTQEEAEAMADALATATDRKIVIASSGKSNASVTTAWSRAAYDPNAVLVATREVMLWQSIHRNGFIVVEDGRRVMKSPASPTVHVRDVLAERLRVSGQPITIVSPVPTLESIRNADDVRYPPGRLWGPVEVVDRTEEPPGSALLTFRVRHAIGFAVGNDDNVFVLVASRGYAPAFKCRNCGELRRCPSCGAALSPTSACRRCGTEVRPCPACNEVQMIPLGAGVGRVVEDVRRFIDPELVGTAEEGRLVTVGSERDLVNRFDVTLGVVVDADGMLGAPHYRAAEDTLRLIARLAQSTDRANSGRVVLQTSDPDHPVIHTLVSGHPQKFLANELDVRKKAGFPPEGQLIAIEVRDSDDADADLRSAVAAPATIRGPAKMRDRQRWLIQGEDLSDTRLALRPVLGRLRNAGAKVRVDADPIDL